jgi:GNAT superfamily N-acetyltransferase
MAAIRLRRCEDDDDLAVSVGIYNATWPLDAISIEEAHAFNDRMDDSEEIVAFLAGEPVGSGVAALFPSLPDRVFTLITVLPGSRRHGVGTALYGAVSAWARERGHDTLRARAREDDPDGLEYALRHGFVEVGRETGLVLQLDGLEPPAIEPPDGIEIAALAERPQTETQLYDVAVETFPDIPDDSEYVFGERDEWLRQHFHLPPARPDATFVALAGEQAVGYAKLQISPARPDTGSHGMTAVRRAWRGRGVAGALKRAQIGWALANGLERLETTNELRNEPMQRVNLGLGYQATPGSITLEGPLAP